MPVIAMFPEATNCDDLLASPYASDLVSRMSFDTLDTPCAYEFSFQDYCHEFGYELPFAA